MFALPPRYAFRSSLATGGSACVDAVFDHARGEVVALKRPRPDAGPAVAAALAREFWALTAFAHPHLVQAHDFLTLPDGSPAFTMALVPAPFPAGPQPEAAVRGWLPGLLDALGVLHRAGLVHGDLRAENLGFQADGACVLLDLGHLAPAGAWDGAGSLAGLAPEAPGAGWRDRRADLYALGALLYRAVAGRDPFEGEAAAVLRAHRAEVPAPLVGVSAGFATLVAGLLAKRPGDRPGDVAAVRAALGLDPQDPAAPLLAGPLVGREDVVAGLASGPAAVVLRGPAGSGRTRVLAQVRHEAQLAGVPVVALDGGGLAGLAAQVAAAGADADPLAAALVRAHWGLAAGDAPSPLDAAREQLRAHAALAALAHAAFPAGTRWLVDDADRLAPGDRAALRALREVGGDRWRWVLAADGPPHPATATLSLGEREPYPLSRDGGGCRQAGGGDPLGGAELPTFALAPLDAIALAALGSAALGAEQAPAGLGEALAATSAGRPGAARALLAAWRAAGALALDDAGWRFDVARAEGLPELPAPAAGLPPAAQALAEAAAVLGDAGSLADLAQVAPDGEAFAATLQDLFAAGTLVPTPAGWAFPAPGTAAAWRAALPPARRQALHARAAALVGDPLAAARHAAQASDPATWPAIAQALDQALAAHAIAPAADLLALAEAQLPPPTDPALADRLTLARAHVLRARGQVAAALDVLDDALLARLAARRDPGLAQAVTTRGVLFQLAGRYPEALARYREAASLAADDPVALVRARLFAGRTAFFLGDGPAAAAHLAAAVDAAQAPAAEGLRAWAEALHGHWLATRSHCGRGRGSDADRGSPAAEGRALLDAAVARAAARHDPYHLHEARHNQGDAWLAAGRPAEAAEAFAACLAIATRHGLANEAVFAHANLALADLARGLARSAGAHARRALTTALAQGRRYPEGLARAALGAAEVLAGAPAAGLAQLGEALDLARGIGHRYLELLALALRADAFALLGDRAAAAADLAAAEELAAATGDHEHDARLAATRAALGLPGTLPPVGPDLAAAGAAELERRLHEVLTAAGDPAEALAALAAEAEARGLVRLAAEVAVAPTRPAGHPPPQAGEGATTPLPPGEGAGRRVRAHEATPDLGATLAAAQDAGLALHEVALLARDPAADPARRREAARRLREIAAPLPAPARAHLAAHPAYAPAAAAPPDAGPLARFAALVAELAQAPDPAALLDRALLAAVDAAGAERGFLVLYDGLAVRQARRVGRDEPGFADFSLGLAHRVLFSGEACFLEDVHADADLAARESVRQLGLRAVAAVPLRLDGHVAGVLITDSRIPREAPWGPEVALLAALADHVAAALAHVRHGEALRAERDAVAEAHDLALAALNAGPDAARALVLARAKERVAADAAWLLGPDPEPDLPPTAAALAAHAPVALPWEESGAAGALWALPAGPGRTLVLLRAHGGAPTAAETEALTRMAAVLAAALAPTRLPAPSPASGRGDHVPLPPGEGAREGG